MYRLLTILFAFSCPIIMTSCVSDEKRINHTKLSSVDSVNINPDNAPVNETFENFYDRFISDSTFQFSRVSSKLEGGVSECDTTIYWGNEWEFIDWDYRDDFSNPLDSIVVDRKEDEFNIRSFRIEVGPLYELKFVLVDSIWELKVCWIYTC